MDDQLVIIVPYRNRLHHLREFVPCMLNFLAELSVTIVIMEQADDRPFNRGALFNAGFLLAPKCEWTAFHDIDMLPVDSSCDYSAPASIRHNAGCAEQHGFKLPYLNYLGGVLLAANVAFRAVNGFSNSYWGWGCEDDDLFLRFWRAGVSIERIPGRYRSLPHSRTGYDETFQVNQEIFSNILMQSVARSPDVSAIDPRAFRRAANEVYIPRAGAEDLSLSDGLSTIQYRVVERLPLKCYTHFEVPIHAKHEMISVEIIREDDR